MPEHTDPPPGASVPPPPPAKPISPLWLRIGVPAVGVTLLLAVGAWLWSQRSIPEPNPTPVVTASPSAGSPSPSATRPATNPSPPGLRASKLVSGLVDKGYTEVQVSGVVSVDGPPVDGPGTPADCVAALTNAIIQPTAEHPTGTCVFTKPDADPVTLTSAGGEITLS